MLYIVNPIGENFTKKEIECLNNKEILD